MTSGHGVEFLLAKGFRPYNNILESVNATWSRTPKFRSYHGQGVQTESHRRLYDGSFLLLALLPWF